MLCLIGWFGGDDGPTSLIYRLRHRNTTIANSKQVLFLVWIPIPLLPVVIEDYYVSVRCGLDLAGG